jgi:hypothetical protein
MKNENIATGNSGIKRYAGLQLMITIPKPVIILDYSAGIDGNLHNYMI